MNPEGPRVSLVVLAADRPEYLRATLRSIAQQTQPPAEILLPGGVQPVDASDTPTEVVGGGIPVRVLEGDAGPGGRAFLAEAPGAARGELVGFVQAGSRLVSEHVELLAACLEASGRIGCYSDAERCVHGPNGEESCRPLGSVEFDPLGLLLGDHIPLDTLLFRRASLIEVGGFDRNAPGDPVWDLLLRIAARGTLHHIRRITVRLPPDAGRPPPDGHIATDTFYARHGALLNAELVGRLAGIRAALCRFQERAEALERELAEERRYKRLLADALDERRTALDRAANRCQELEAANRVLQSRYEAVHGQLEAIQGSRAWRVVRAYGELRGRLRPPASSRHVLRRGVEVLEKEGVQGIKRRLRQSVTLSQVDRGRYPFAPVAPEEVALDLPSDPLDARISVIIPTRNAGPEFRRTLRRIRSQVAVPEPEILIIDSDSTDGTVETARAEGARVLQIPPEAFHHAETRNQAARHARGEILVFTVQDALPAAPDWLYRLVAPVVQGEADAVSARQIPRADADLYALVATWGFHRFLGYGRNTLRKGMALAGRPLAEQRRIAHLDNVCLAISRELQVQFPFQGRFAEDLDLGKRLVEGGFGLLHQVDNAVVHSHTRPARYFFLRAYVDLRSLQHIFDGSPPQALTTSEQALSTLALAYNLFAQELWNWLREDRPMQAAPGPALEGLRDRLDHAFERGESQGAPPAWDPALFLSFMAHKAVCANDAFFDRVRRQVTGQLHPLGAYLSLRAGWGCSEEAVACALHKIFAAAAGCALAEAGVELPAGMVKGI